MLVRVLQIILSVGSIGLLVADAPKGRLLVSTPERGRVKAEEPNQRMTARGRGPTFLWLGGGYHGGK